MFKFSFYINLSLFKGISQNSIELVLFHSTLLILLLFIRVFVGSIILGYLENNIVHRRAWSAFSNKILPEPEFWLEYIWIGWPSIILLLCLTKGLGLLYKVDRIISPELTVKITGYQWFWTYELSDIWYWVIKKRPFLNWESHLKNLDLGVNDLRLLVVDKPLILPIRVPVRGLVSRADVIHSWSLPQVRIKSDAVPGRLNQVLILFKEVGKFYGICSEICGSGHSKIPIVVTAVTQKTWLGYL